MLQVSSSAAASIKHDGMVENIGAGPDMQSKNRYMFRVSSVLTPTSNISDTTVFDYGHRDEVPVALITSHMVPGGLADARSTGHAFVRGRARPTRTPCGIRKIDSADPMLYNKTTTYGVSNVFTDGLGHGLTFKYILGYRYTETRTTARTSQAFTVPVENLLGEGSRSTPRSGPMKSSCWARPSTTG